MSSVFIQISTYYGTFFLKLKHQKVNDEPFYKVIKNIKLMLKYLTSSTRVTTWLWF